MDCILSEDGTGKYKEAEWASKIRRTFKPTMPDLYVADGASVHVYRADCKYNTSESEGLSILTGPDRIGLEAKDIRTLWDIRFEVCTSSHHDNDSVCFQFRTYSMKLDEKDLPYLALEHESALTYWFKKSTFEVSTNGERLNCDQKDILDRCLDFRYDHLTSVYPGLKLLNNIYTPQQVFQKSRKYPGLYCFGQEDEKLIAALSPFHALSFIGLGLRFNTQGEPWQQLGLTEEVYRSLEPDWPLACYAAICHDPVPPGDDLYRSFARSDADGNVLRFVAKYKLPFSELLQYLIRQNMLRWENRPPSLYPYYEFISVLESTSVPSKILKEIGLMPDELERTTAFLRCVQSVPIQVKDFSAEVDGYRIQSWRTEVDAMRDMRALSYHTGFAVTIRPIHQPDTPYAAMTHNLLFFGKKVPMPVLIKAKELLQANA